MTLALPSSTCDVLFPSGSTVAMQCPTASRRVVVRAPKMKEAWCLATTLSKRKASEVVKLYGKRFTIEETFRDEKNLHFGMGREFAAQHDAQAAIVLDDVETRRALGEDIGERADAGADLEDRVLVVHLRELEHARDHAGIDKKVLAQALSRREPFALQEGAGFGGEAGHAVAVTPRRRSAASPRRSA